MIRSIQILTLKSTERNPVESGSYKFIWISQHFIHIFCDTFEDEIVQILVHHADITTAAEFFFEVGAANYAVASRRNVLNESLASFEGVRLERHQSSKVVVPTQRCTR